MLRNLSWERGWWAAPLRTLLHRQQVAPGRTVAVESQPGSESRTGRLLEAGPSLSLHPQGGESQRGGAAALCWGLAWCPGLVSRPGGPRRTSCWGLVSEGAAGDPRGKGAAGRKAWELAGEQVAGESSTEPQSLVDTNRPDRGSGQCGGVIEWGSKNIPQLPGSGLVGLPAAGTSWRGELSWGGLEEGGSDCLESQSNLNSENLPV